MDILLEIAIILRILDSVIPYLAELSKWGHPTPNI